LFDAPRSDPAATRSTVISFATDVTVTAAVADAPTAEVVCAETIGLV
jgi:hypothetical protein